MATVVELKVDEASGQIVGKEVKVTPKLLKQLTFKTSSFLK